MVIKAINYLDNKLSETNSVLNKNFNSLKINFIANNSVSSFCNKFGKHKPPTNESKSPYLNGTKVQMLAQMSGRKFVQKKSMDMSLSFSQANKIYKANSDEFRCIKGKRKKNKLSLSTVSNELTNMQQTVSDMNDSDYRNRVDNNRRCKRRRRPPNNFARRYLDNKNYEFYNGDLLLGPAIKADKPNSNEDKKNYNKKPKIKRKRKSCDNVRPSDVWTMLRNMNRFQCVSSPPISEDSTETIKRREDFVKYPKKRELIETTEEFSYISSYDINNKLQSVFSRPSSFDRITIIDKKDDLRIKELIESSFANTLSSRLQKKDSVKTKFQNNNREHQYVTKIRKELDFSKTENVARDVLSNNTSETFKDTMSKETLHGFSDSHSHEMVILGSCANNFKTIDKKGYAKKQLKLNKRESFLDANRLPDSDNQLSEASEISSKAGLKGLYNIKITNKPKIKNLTSDASLNKKNESFSQNLDLQRKNKCAPYFHKLTITEIRRQLARLKFPIVILNKDEVSSTFHVVDYEPPQFDGLNQCVWPFMIEWSLSSKNTKSLRNRFKHMGSVKNKQKVEVNLLNNGGNRITDSISPHATNVNVTYNTPPNKKDSEIKILKSIDAINTKKVISPKQKVLNQFKNKMMDLIYNKSQKSLVCDNIVIENSNSQVLDNCATLVQEVKSSTNSEIHGSLQEQNAIKRHENIAYAQKSQFASKRKYPWAKAKWASDFIDNIIKKIRKGVYYTQNSEAIKENLNDSEASIKTDSEYSNATSALMTKDIDNTIIPGFDDDQDVKTLKLEVKMITRTQISVHHCQTNVVLQFDVTIPSVTDSVLSSSFSSCLPVVPSGHKSTLYKCKTRIPNAILPAELCCILPKLINEIMNGNKTNLIVADYADTMSDIDNKSGSIEEMSSLKSIDQSGCLENGEFSSKSLLQITSYTNNRKLHKKDMYQLKNIICPVIEIKPLLSFMRIIHKSLFVKTMEPNITQCITKTIFKEKPSNKCMALVPYVSPIRTMALKLMALPTCKFALDAKHAEKNVTKYVNFTTCIWPWQRQSVVTESYHTKTMRVLGTFDLVPKSSRILSICNTPYNPTEQIENNNLITTNAMKVDKLEKVFVKNGVRRPKSLKPYKRHKSNTLKDIYCTSLNKIANLDDFLNALGCCKALSNVLKGYSERIILSSIFEMKSWIEEITQGQALLVLLLANKKETTNVKRFRPLLLQGIAVNRITTAEELDMEVEVIEKENLCVSQNEGFSFLSGTNNNLLDELCWIAKTTASDYQKPFDESSKKLLKALLAKRKKLNPSYLRVMARYVGLGLLKPRGA